MGITGWKTVTGAVIMAVAGILEVIPVETCGTCSEYAEMLLYIGGALGLVGIGHKVEKAAN